MNYVAKMQRRDCSNCWVFFVQAKFHSGPRVRTYTTQASVRVISERPVNGFQMSAVQSLSRLIK